MLLIEKVKQSEQRQKDHTIDSVGIYRPIYL